MKLTIHRGTHQIGGSCIELESDGKRLILDLGLPLSKPDGSPFRMRLRKSLVSSLVPSRPRF